MNSGHIYRCVHGTAAVHSSPERSSMQLTELLYGEEFVVRADGNSDHWLLGSARADAVEGYVERPALQPASGSATHRVARKYITVFNQPILTATTKLLLPLNALLRVNGNRDTIHYA